jgi:hypothetical protein
MATFKEHVADFFRRCGEERDSPTARRALLRQRWQEALTPAVRCLNCVGDCVLVLPADYERRIRAGIEPTEEDVRRASELARRYAAASSAERSRMRAENRWQRNFCGTED